MDRCRSKEEKGLKRRDGEGIHRGLTGVRSCMSCAVEAGHVLESDLSRTVSWARGQFAICCLVLSPLDQGGQTARLDIASFLLETEDRKLMPEQGVEFSHGDDVHSSGCSHPPTTPEDHEFHATLGWCVALHSPGQPGLGCQRSLRKMGL